MAAKRTAAKQSQATIKKRTARTTALQPVTIRYRCKKNLLGKKKPNASPKFAHLLKKGNMVDLVAIGTDVDIQFTAGSPFSSSHLTIAAGTTRTEAVVVTSGTFEYTLSCGACPSKGPKSAGPPQMIVP